MGRAELTALAAEMGEFLAGKEDEVAKHAKHAKRMSAMPAVWRRAVRPRGGICVFCVICGLIQLVCSHAGLDAGFYWPAITLDRLALAGLVPALHDLNWDQNRARHAQGLT